MTKMSKKEVERRVNESFRALERVAIRTGEGFNLFERVEREAEQSELGHRRMGRGWSDRPYRQNVKTAARYFVCKWYAEHEPGKLMTAKDAAGMRSDALVAAALRDLIPECPFDAVKLLEIDYVEHIAPTRS